LLFRIPEAIPSETKNNTITTRAFVRAYMTDNERKGTTNSGVTLLKWADISGRLEDETKETLKTRGKGGWWKI
jgi:hypothetical protein